MKITVSYCSLLAILFSIIACGKEIDGIEKIDKIGGMVFI